ncbi:unnamed protein product [Dibothriocephalus latus]|uniref:Uncharacterized protein n=1 Tax=Dibothriocephalus latus TaxID=60516 RepID=A0A3P7LCW4_DIBLA|nr:unnamed protein product [Dibothriocephalus latus]
MEIAVSAQYFFMSSLADFAVVFLSSVGHFFLTNTPGDCMDVDEVEKEAIENEDPDKRISIMAADKATHGDNEFYDSAEEDGIGLHAQHSSTKPNKDAQSYKNLPKRARTEDKDVPVGTKDATVTDAPPKETEASESGDKEDLDHAAKPAATKPT